jgi:hypothetical protein
MLCALAVWLRLWQGLEGEARVQVLIYGPANVNRAVDGDVVAVEILPRSQWLSTGALARAQDKDDEDSDVEKDADDKVRYTMRQNNPAI